MGKFSESAFRGGWSGRLFRKAGFEFVASALRVTGWRVGYIIGIDGNVAMGLDSKESTGFVGGRATKAKAEVWSVLERIESPLLIDNLVSGIGIWKVYTHLFKPTHDPCSGDNEKRVFIILGSAYSQFFNHHTPSSSPKTASSPKTLG